MRHVVFNQKGGVGKSTITCNLAAVGASQCRRTLVIDLDGQGNSTRYLLGEAAAQAGDGAGGFFEQTLRFTARPQGLDAFIVATPFAHLDVLPAGPLLDELHGKLESRYKIYKLKEALDALDGLAGYEAVWIDTPPALNFYTRSALIAAEGCLIPFDCDDFSRRALYTLLEHVAEIQADHNAGLRVAGIVVNQFQPRASLPARTVAELVAEGLPVREPYLPASVKVKESHEAARPLVYLDARHKLTQAFVDLHAGLARPPKARKPLR